MTIDEKCKELTEEQIRFLFKKSTSPNTNSEIGHYEKTLPSLLKNAAVLIPMLQINGDWQILFIKRTNFVKNHKNQVAFPGGGSEIQDNGSEGTALRETEEEIGVLKGDIRILGEFLEPIDVTNYRVYPVVGTFHWPYPFKLSKEEVDYIFTIPLTWLADKDNWEIRILERGGKKIPVIYYKPYQEEILWGATARMVINLLEVLQF